jgi:hypothetical protein
MRYVLEDFLRHPQWKIVDDEKFQSYKKRVKDGNDAFEKQETSKQPHDEIESEKDDGDELIPA